MSKGFTIYKYTFKDYHYKGISRLQDYYGKKLSTSNGSPCEIGDKLLFLKEIKQRQLYTTLEKIKLNDMRIEYLKDKKTTP